MADYSGERLLRQTFDRYLVDSIRAYCAPPYSKEDAEKLRTLETFLHWTRNRDG